MSDTRPPAQTAGRSRVLAWALWDCGSTGFNAIVVTFVFSVYLTRTVGDDLPGDTSPASWLGRALAARRSRVRPAGPGHRDLGRRAVAATPGAGGADRADGAADVRDEPDPRRPPLSVGRVSCCWPARPPSASWPPCPTTPCCGSSPPRTHPAGCPDSVGRWAISAALCCWLMVYLGFISGDGDTRGALDIPVADGQNVRAAMLLTAAWFALFALPLLSQPASPRRHRGRARRNRRILRRLPQAVVRGRRRMAARPQRCVLPAGQRGVPRRAGRRVRLRRGARRQRLRHIRGQRIAVRRERERGRRASARCSAGCSTTGSAPSRSSSAR